MNRRDQLWADWIDGRLPAAGAEHAELLRAWTDDPAWRSTCLAELRLVREIEALGRVAADGARFTAGVDRALAYCGDRTAFVRRVERRLRRRPAQRRRLPIGLLAIPLAAGLLLTTFLLWPSAAPAGWRSPTADADARAAGQPLRPGMDLPPGSDLSGSRIVLDGPDGSRLELRAADAQLLPDDRHALLLRSGALTAAIAPQRGDRFRIRTPHATVEVVGTRFEVAVTGRATTIAVTEGVVRFRDAAGDRELRAGDRASSEPPAAPRESRLGLPGYLVGWDFTGLPPDVAVIPTMGGEPGTLRVEDPSQIRAQADGLDLIGPTRLVAERGGAAWAEAIRQAGGFTIEALVTSRAEHGADTAETGPARMITWSSGSRQRNFTLGWGEMHTRGPVWSLRLRRDVDGNPLNAGRLNGMPSFLVPATPERRTHLVVSYDAARGVRWLVDGRPVEWRASDHDGDSGSHGGGLTAWDGTAPFILGGEADDRALDRSLRGWLGTYHRVVLYAGVLDDATARSLVP